MVTMVKSVVVGVAVAATIVSLVGVAAADPEVEQQGAGDRPSRVLVSAGISNNSGINVNADTDQGHRALRLRAMTRAAAEVGTAAAAQVSVRLAQYDSVGGTRTRKPLLKLDPVALSPSSRGTSGTEFSGSVPWSELHPVAEKIPMGQSMLMCVQKVTAMSADGARIPKSQQARAAQHGNSCVELHRRTRKADGANQLLTGVLADASLSRILNKKADLTFSADSLSFFQDRPERQSKSVEFVDLVKKSRWQQVFGDKVPRVEMAVEGSTELVTTKLRRPKAVASGRYRSQVSFPGGRTLNRKAVAGNNLVFFANPLPVADPDPDTCIKVDDEFVPNGADFIGDLRDTTVTAKPGKKYLVLESDDPAFFNWFLSEGTGCQARFTGAVDPALLPSRKQWTELFGDVNPNSALLWQEGEQTQVLEFEQSRPTRNKATGRWQSRIRPFAGDVMPSRDSLRLFKKQYGKQLDLSSAYFFMDSTNSVAYGGEYWVVDNNFQIRYFVQAPTQTMFLTFTLLNGNNGWMGLTFHEFIFPGDSIVAWCDGSPEGGEGQCLDLYNPGIPTIPNFPAPLQDTNPILKLSNDDPYDNVDNVSVDNFSNANGIVSITCQRALVTEDIFDFQIFPDQLFHVVSAYNAKLPWNPQYNAQQPSHTAYGADTWGF